ncbi:MAG: hypothetical protein H7256_05425 [Bdellovibrio sp.]|nr:hypothetical protein [Bdellovibrio sp.]
MKAVSATFITGIILNISFALAANPPATESWTLLESTKFGVFESLARCQGLTNDGQGHFWFSANQKLTRTTSNYTTEEKVNSSPLEEMKNLGANHIGDIDFSNGKIYAPVEDGRDYQHPIIAVYNAQTLDLEKYSEISKEWLPDGIPWLAVDAKHSYLITSQYSHTTHINLYDLQTFKPVRQIPMSQMLTSIQGGKVFGDYLYMTANNETNTGFAVYKMDLMTGQISKIISIDPSVVEIEGLTLNTQADGQHMYVLGLTGSGLGKRIRLFHFKK